MSRLKVEMCKASSVFHILSFPYRPQSHSWGARSLTFFIFVFLPSNTLFFISHFFPNSYPPCCSTLRVNSLFCLWEISPLHYSVTGCGVGWGHPFVTGSQLGICSSFLPPLTVCTHTTVSTLWRSLNVTFMDMLWTKCQIMQHPGDSLSPKQTLM